MALPSQSELFPATWITVARKSCRKFLRNRRWLARGAPAGDGFGIGLTLVRRAAELHGGEVDARNDGPGRGSCFSLRIPLPGSSRT